MCNKKIQAVQTECNDALANADLLISKQDELIFKQYRIIENKIEEISTLEQMLQDERSKTAQVKIERTKYALGGVVLGVLLTVLVQGK